MLEKKILPAVIGYLTIAVSGFAQQAVDTTHRQISTADKFITVGALQFRDFNRNGKLDTYEDYRKPIEQRAQDLLSKMTMEEKLAQLKSPWEGKVKMFTENKFDNDKAIQAFPNGLGEILSLGLGSFVLMPDKAPNASQVAILANQTQSFFVNQTRLGIPVLFLEEALHGLMVRGATNFPSALGMASSWNESLTREVFEAIAQEARAIGAHRVLAPVLDLALDPRWGRTEETMGEKIVQLYIRDEVSSVTRPIKELKDFKRIALSPGETKQVSFTITPDKLKFYDINMKELIEPGDFQIMVGPSSRKHETVKLRVL